MNDLPNRTARSYGASVGLYVLTGLLAALFLGMGVGVGRQSGNWIPFYLFSGVLVLVLAMLQLMRFKVGPDGFTCRTTQAVETIDFADVTRGYFIITVVIHNGFPSQRVTDFGVEKKDGTTFRFNLRHYSVKAAAHLFDELDRHGIPIEVPDIPAAHRMDRQIRKAQAKLRAKSSA